MAILVFVHRALLARLSFPRQTTQRPAPGDFRRTAAISPLHANEAGCDKFLVLGENRPLAYVEKFRKQFSFVRERISTSSLFLAHLCGQLFELALLFARYDVRLLAFHADRQIVGIRH